MALAPGFEWFVAWRHLRDPDRGRHRGPLLVGLGIIALGLIALAVSWWLNRGPRMGWLGGRSVFAENIHFGGLGAVALGTLIALFGTLYALFTLFTAISIFGVFIGTAFPIVALSVMSGFESDLKTKIRGAKADVVITRADDKPFIGWQDVQKDILGIPGVLASTPYIESEVMVRSGGNPASVILRGIDPKTAASVLDLGRTLKEGRVDDLDHPERIRDPWMLPGERKGDKADKSGKAPAPPEPGAKPASVIFLGEELYQRNLRVFMGSDIEVVCPSCGVSPMGSIPAARPFKVGGYFYSGMYEFDSKLAYVSLTAAQKLFEMPGEITGLDIRAATPEQAGEIAAAIAARLNRGQSSPSAYDVRSWEELNKGLFMALKLEKIAMFIVLTFIALVASFSIVSNLIMLVTEKAREVAILKAMGASNGAVLRVFFAEGMYIGLLGLLMGVATGVLGCVLIKAFGLPLPTDVYYISKLPVVMKVSEIGTVAALALLLCCLATVYPALLASRMRPVQGLRYE